MIKNFEGAIFDLDGTLINSGGYSNTMWSNIGEKYLNDSSFRPNREDDKATRTMLLREIMKFIHEKYKAGESFEELYDYVKDGIRNYYANEVTPKEGVIPFLDYCLEHNIKMCIASATEKDEIMIAVKSCGLEKYFPVILSCADVGKGKECPNIFNEALKALGTSPEKTWVFEDSLTAIKTAGKAGLNTVGIYDEFNFGHEEMKEVSTVYVDRGETMEKLINEE